MEPTATIDWKWVRYFDGLAKTVRRLIRQIVIKKDGVIVASSLPTHFDQSAHAAVAAGVHDANPAPTKVAGLGK
jgi:predicted regulator of Ras-like GTPase activity (Roadblock/LC7/MglB family)